MSRSPDDLIKGRGLGVAGTRDAHEEGTVTGSDAGPSFRGSRDVSYFSIMLRWKI